MRLLDRIALGNGGSLVTAQHRTGRLVFSIAEPGEHWVDNSLGVMAAVQAAKGELGAAGLALAEMGGLSGRGARHRFAVPGGRATVIDESYNANPASMRATLTQLAQTPANRRIAVLGSMKELGDFSERFHAALRDPIEAADLDLLVLVGEEMRTLHARLKTGGGGNGMQIIHCAGASEASNALDEFELVGGDVVLVKGSNSVGLSAVIAHLTGSPQ
jgi:UDP-N-acetylmuramoyl-tripeptide--D-alanyl-D-alanine ligase